MKPIPHNLTPGYYWYAIENDPLCILHILSHGDAHLMGNHTEVPAEDIAAMIARGGRFALIPPPEGL